VAEGAAGDGAAGDNSDDASGKRQAEVLLGLAGGATSDGGDGTASRRSSGSVGSAAVTPDFCYFFPVELEHDALGPPTW
jgi:hypothetical protein